MEQVVLGFSIIYRFTAQKRRGCRNRTSNPYQHNEGEIGMIQTMEHEGKFPQ